MTAPTAGSPPHGGGLPPLRWTTRHFSQDRLIQFALVAIVVFLVVVPLAPVLYQSILAKPLYETPRSTTLANYFHFFASADFHAAITNSFVLALVSTLVATAIGAAWFVMCLGCTASAAGKPIDPFRDDRDRCGSKRARLPCGRLAFAWARFVKHIKTCLGSNGRASPKQICLRTSEAVRRLCVPDFRKGCRLHL